MGFEVTVVRTLMEIYVIEMELCTVVTVALKIDVTPNIEELLS